MTRKEYKDLLKSDYLRYSDDTSLKGRIKVYMTKPGYVWSHWYRKLCYQRSQAALKPLAFFTRLHYHRICVKYGIDIPSNVKQIGPAFKIDHFSCIVVNTNATIGRNVTLRHGCTIGEKPDGAPTIEDNVDIGACSIILGHITIGKGAIIGAGSVVTKDVAAGSVVAGNPAVKIKNI